MGRLKAAVAALTQSNSVAIRRPTATSPRRGRRRGNQQPAGRLRVACPASAGATHRNVAGTAAARAQARPGAVTARAVSAIASDANSRSPHTVPKRVSRTSPTASASSASQNEAPAARRALKDEPGRAGDNPISAATAISRRRRALNAWAAALGGRGERRTEGEQGEQEPADDQRGRGVGEEPHRPSRGSGHGPGVRISEEVGNALAAGAAPGSPTPKTKPPEIGWSRRRPPGTWPCRSRRRDRGKRDADRGRSRRPDGSARRCRPAPRTSRTPDGPKLASIGSLK